MTGRSAALPASPPRRAAHDALLYDSPGALVDVAVPFLLEGLAAGDAAVIATSAPTAAVLCEAVDGDPRVHVLDRTAVYAPRTATAITTYRRLSNQRIAGPGGRVRVVGQIDYGPTARDWLEWQRYEAVVNEALAGWPLWGLCVFDTQRLPEPLLESARQTHPWIHTPGGRSANPDFVAPADYLRSLTIPVEPLEATPPRLWAHDVADFVGLRLWIGADRVVCTIDDHGAGFDDPFAGYGPAHGEDLSRGGMGLWLARQLCDHVDISGDRDGTHVRLTIRVA